MSTVYKCYKCGFLGTDDEMYWTSDEDLNVAQGRTEYRGLCHICEEKRELKKKLENTTESKGEIFQVGAFKTEIGGGEDIVCPHCGDTREPDWEMSEHYTGSDEWYEMECYECEKFFELHVEVSYTRTTRKKITDADVEEAFNRRQEP